MERKLHNYSVDLAWTGNTGNGTSNYGNYERSHTIKCPSKVILECSSDAAFNGDNTKYNPKELLIASVSSCHMLWYLHLCSEANIVVTAYRDNATGLMQEETNGAGKFISLCLRPLVTVAEASMVEKAEQLHNAANEKCFIANSLNFPVTHHPTFKVDTA